MQATQMQPHRHRARLRGCLTGFHAAPGKRHFHHAVCITVTLLDQKEHVATPAFRPQFQPQCRAQASPDAGHMPQRQRSARLRLVGRHLRRRLLLRHARHLVQNWQPRDPAPRWARRDYRHRPLGPCEPLRGGVLLADLRCGRGSLMQGVRRCRSPAYRRKRTAIPATPRYSPSVLNLEGRSNTIEWLMLWAEPGRSPPG